MGVEWEVKGHCHTVLELNVPFCQANALSVTKWWFQQASAHGVGERMSLVAELAAVHEVSPPLSAPKKSHKRGLL